MDSSRPTPNLQQILANLAQLGSSAQRSPATVHNNETLSDVSRVPTTSTHARTSPPAASPQAREDDPRLRPQSKSTVSPAPIIDPATITTWQDGLRCVTKLAAQNSQFGAGIRTMMEQQRRQEMQWYAERQALKQVHANRARSAAEAQSILRSLTNGGNAGLDDPKLVRRDVDVAAELTSFDRKLYDSQVAMESVVVGELKALGVPFFGTPEALVVADEDVTWMAQTSNNRPKWSPIITKSQLLRLQRRMIEHLEDLYRE